MKIRSHIRSVRLVFSIFLLQILAGLTGCKDDGTEFMEKELVQEESTEASGMDAEQEELKDTESEVSGKVSATLYVTTQGLRQIYHRRNRMSLRRNRIRRLKNSCRRSQTPLRPFM